MVIALLSLIVTNAHHTVLLINDIHTPQSTMEDSPAEQMSDIGSPDGSNDLNWERRMAKSYHKFIKDNKEEFAREAFLAIVKEKPPVVSVPDIIHSSTNANDERKPAARNNNPASPPESRSTPKAVATASRRQYTTDALATLTRHHSPS
jgi:hypothetical protein